MREAEEINKPIPLLTLNYNITDSVKRHIKPFGVSFNGIWHHLATAQTRFEDYEQQRCQLISGFVVGNARKSWDFPPWLGFKSTLRYTAVLLLCTRDLQPSKVLGGMWQDH